MLLQLLNSPPHSKSTMISPIITIAEGTKENNRIESNTGVGYLAKIKVVKIEDNTTEGRRSRIRKEGVVCVQAKVGKKKFIVQFKDGKKRHMSSISLSYIFSKQEVCLEMDDPISDLPEK